MKDLSNENIIHIKKDGMEYIQFRRLLEYKEIVHGYSLGLDKNFRTARAGDEVLNDKQYNNAILDYTTFVNVLDLKVKNTVKGNQAHTNNIKIVNEKVNKDIPDFNLKEYSQIDGLITNKKDITLSTTNADCILMIFYDPTKKVIANIHSGWKGTLQRIAIETLDNLKKEFNCNMGDIICCISPSIRKCHFEVSKDVKEMFEKEFTDIKEEITEKNIIEETIKEQKWHIDTVEINKIILKQFGVKEDNIIDSKICSVCESEQIHSYRVEKQDYGLHTLVVAIK